MVSSRAAGDLQIKVNEETVDQNRNQTAITLNVLRLIVVKVCPQTDDLLRTFHVH